ncbi:MAG: DedA family protein [Bacteroidales bacterium]
MALLTGDFAQNLLVYGYFLIFALVFLQEVGFPNPVPNEIVLLFSGYVAYTGKLNIIYAILSAFGGDVLGSAILFILFFFFGKKILTNKPRWIPISVKKLESLRLTLEAKGDLGIFLGRLSPFIRGYVSVLSGLMNFSKKRFSVIAVSTGLIWSSFYLLIGYFVGPYWSKSFCQMSDYSLYIGLIPLSILSLYLVYVLIKYLLSTNRKRDIAI